MSRARLRHRLRPAIMVLHWSVPVVIVGTLAWPAPGWRIALAVAAFLWVASAMAAGLNRAGPALTGLLRPLHFWSHVGLLAGLSAAALLTAFDRPLARPFLFVTLVLGLLHGIFHLWRHTVLGDGALRHMLPRALHGGL